MKFTIDNVDFENPEHGTFLNPIGAHDKIAKYYKARPPYFPRFFSQVVKELGIDSSSALLDLCCGTGVLSTGLSKYARKIYGVDGSRDMLAHATRHDNLELIECDVNKQQLELPEKVAHIFIGDAIWWIQGNRLQAMADACLLPGGSIVITHTNFVHAAEPFGPILDSINQSYKKNFLPLDFSGGSVLKACGFNPVRKLGGKGRVSFGIDFLVRNQLSYAYRDFYDATHENVDQYRSEVTTALTPLAVDGKLSTTLVNWGVVYKAATAS